MAFFTTATVNARLDDLATDLVYGSVHSAYSTTGANEASGGSYARQTLSWASASGGTVSTNTAESWTLASFTARWIGFWSAVTAGTFYGMVPVGATKALTANAYDTDDYIYSDSHGFVDTDTVVMLPADGSATMPGGLTAGTVYYVVSAATDRFQVAATSGGAAINVTSSQEVWLSDIDPAVFTASAALTIASGSITLKAV